MPRSTAIAIVLALAIGGVGRASAVTVDGQLDPSYTLFATQATQTNGSDNTQGVIDFGNGSELDAAYATVDAGVLYLFFTGNLLDDICGREACTNFAVLNFFIDSAPGGQNPIVSPSPVGVGMQGLTFDAGFAPDHWFQYADVGALDHAFSRKVWYEALPAGGGGASVYLGGGSNAGAPGTLAGGSDPFGVQATIDNRNLAGVGAGCGPASGAGVTTGVEFAIPLAAIGSPTGCIRCCAIVVNEAENPGVLNQVLPPVPPGVCSLTPPASTDFSTIPGDQFFTICLGPTSVHASNWGALKAIYR